MKRNLQNDPYAECARAYADAISVPRFNRAAIEHRSPRRAYDEAPKWRSYLAAAVIVLGLVAWAAPAMPALIADVQNAVQLFLEHNGQLVPATDRLVTIDQATHDLPFRVIPPSGVPLAAAPSVREVSIAGDPTSARLLVQYPSNLQTPRGGMTAMPALTIVETVASASPENILFAAHPLGVPPMRPPSGAPPAGAVQIKALSETWTVGGTRITLLGTPGAITQAQLQAIRRAMGG